MVHITTTSFDVNLYADKRYSLDDSIDTPQIQNSGKYTDEKRTSLVGMDSSCQPRSLERFQTLNFELETRCRVCALTSLRPVYFGSRPPHSPFCRGGSHRSGGVGRGQWPGQTVVLSA